MAASYPNTLKVFTTKHNVTDIVDQSDVNSIQDEILAMQTTLGLRPHDSAARGTVYADVDTRLERVELDYSLNTHVHAHPSLTGDAAGDDHTQYMLAAGGRHDLTGRHAFGAALGNPGAPTATNPGDVAAVGAGAAPARENHVHGVYPFGTGMQLVALNAVSRDGTANSFARGDHAHGLPVAAPAALTIGGAQVTGTATSVSLADHQHAMPTFAAVVASTTFGQAAANGVSASVAHADHVHGTLAVGLVADITSVDVADAAAAGASGRAADAAHQHAFPAPATVSAMQVFGIAPSVGVSTKPAREDHNHGTPDPTLQGPSGAIVMWPGTGLPSGWLFCDGSAVSRTTYATLYGVISTRAGAGDGSTTFNLPDFRQRVPFGNSTLASAIVLGNLGTHQHAGTSGVGAAHSHGASSAAGSSHSHSLSIPSGTGAGSNHAHTGTTGADDRNHIHFMSAHSHQWVGIGQVTDPVHDTGGPSNPWTDIPNTGHLHAFTSAGEAGHTHTIGASSLGSEAAHTHGITINNEASHTHGFTTDQQTPVQYTSIAFIIKT